LQPTPLQCWCCKGVVVGRGERRRSEASNEHFRCGTSSAPLVGTAAPLVGTRAMCTSLRHPLSAREQERKINKRGFANAADSFNMFFMQAHAMLLECRAGGEWGMCGNFGIGGIVIELTSKSNKSLRHQHAGTQRARWSSRARSNITQADVAALSPSLFALASDLRAVFFGCGCSFKIGPLRGKLNMPDTPAHKHCLHAGVIKLRSTFVAKSVSVARGTHGGSRFLDRANLKLNIATNGVYRIKLLRH
jgi:hypothetical protein